MREEGPSAIPESLVERWAMLKRLLWQARLKERERLVVVMDGLEEAEEVFSPPVSIPLPERVFFVVSGRWDGQGEPPEYLKRWLEFTERIPLHALTKEDISEWLKGEEGLEEFAEDGEFVRALCQKSGGFPLFLYFLLEDLKQVAKKRGNVREALERTPKGFQDYIREQFSPLQALSETILLSEGCSPCFQCRKGRCCKERWRTSWLSW